MNSAQHLLVKNLSISSMLEKTNLESLLQYTAVLLTCFGIYCLSCQLLNPFTFPGAITYTLFGVILTIMAYKIQLPVALYRLLYQQSLLDVLLEPSPYADLYVVLALCIILPPEQIKRYITLLPPEMSFITRPGMIHFLPESVQNTLNNVVTGDTIDENRHTRDGLRQNEAKNSTVEGTPSISTIIYNELQLKMKRFTFLALLNI